MSEVMTVGAIAELTGVSVRTLHHYDEIGLVVPSERSESGYRIYDGSAMDRLQEVLIFRELGFGLQQIKEIIDSPGYLRHDVLVRHKELLERKADRLSVIIDAVDRSIREQEKGINMTNEEKLKVFGDFDPSEFEEEAEQRWGGTDEYTDSVRRTKDYTAQDWETINAENADIYAGFVAIMGQDADSPAAADLVERHRQHISRWYYECTPEIHAGLGQMYVADARFTKNIDKTAEGLAAFMAEAIAAAYFLSQRSKIGRHVDRVLPEDLDRHDIQHVLVRRSEHHMRRSTIVMRPQPIASCHAPAVAGHEPRKAVLRNGSTQIVPDVALVFEELSGNHGTDGVATEVLGTG